MRVFQDWSYFYQRDHLQKGTTFEQVFRGASHLDEQQRVSPAEAKEIQQSILKAAKLMKSEAAWAAASRRAGSLFGLPRESGTDAAAWDESEGYEAVREFSAGVQLVSPGRRDEFFSAGGEGGGTSRGKVRLGREAGGRWEGPAERVVGQGS